MVEIYRHELTVTPDQIDRWGHVNNRVYLKWMEEAAVDHSSVNEWPPQRYAELGRGWVARSHFIEYLKPAFAGDEIVVHTWVADFQRVTSRRRYRIERLGDQAILAKAETNWAFVNLQTFTLARIPPEVGECFPTVPDEA